MAERTQQVGNISLFFKGLSHLDFRIAGELAQINPDWTDEELWQNSRNIVVAEMEHITYSEYLREVLGDFYMSTITSSNTYDPSIDASASLAFSTAVFRFGHSQVPDSLR